jgi:hypothetical protein
VNLWFNYMIHIWSLSYVNSIDANIVKMHALYLQSNKEGQVSYPWRQHAYNGHITQFPVTWTIIVSQHIAKKLSFCKNMITSLHQYIKLNNMIYINCGHVKKYCTFQICSSIFFIVKYIFAYEAWKSQVIVYMVNMMRGIYWSNLSRNYNTWM